MYQMNFIENIIMYCKYYSIAVNYVTGPPRIAVLVTEGATLYNESNNNIKYYP